MKKPFLKGRGHPVRRRQRDIWRKLICGIMCLLLVTAMNITLLPPLTGNAEEIGLTETEESSVTETQKDSDNLQETILETDETGTDETGTDDETGASDTDEVDVKETSETNRLPETEEQTEQTDIDGEEKVSAGTVAMPKTFTYEDDYIDMILHVDGEAVIEGTDTELSDAENPELKVEKMDADSAAYQQAEELVRIDENSHVALTALDIQFYSGDVLLDVSDCNITAEIKPKESLLEDVYSAGKARAQSAVPQEVCVSVMQISGDNEQSLEVTELDSKVVEAGRADTAVFTVPVTDGIIALAATDSANPSFTVQYYANLDVVKDAQGELAVIDTSGKKLPVNGDKNLPTKNLKLVNVGNGKYKIDVETKLTEVYRSRKYQYHDVDFTDGTEGINSLTENEHYALKSIWVLKDGKDSGSTNPDDWNKYDPENVAFTNGEGGAGGNTIVIKDDTVIRMVYETVSGEYTNAVNFYDYDITDGNGYTYKGGEAQGINSPANYTGDGAKLSFGNANTGTRRDTETWENNYLNRANANSYKNCTFGLVTGLSDGKIQYADGVSAPSLFNEGSANGKKAYSSGEYSLDFNRDGDTYILSGVAGANLSGLEYFNLLTHYTKPDGTKGDTFWNNNKIYTNNFWPMDSKEGTDGLTGEYTNEGSYIGKDGLKPYPSSDDSIAHNNMFGMQYTVSFTLSEEYVGPLEYYFFGDDDMWVFLDDQLVCDIGGVHSSVGEYVNLWDYLKKGSSGTHTLNFFYTERGLSGSSCYMQFTLPSVTSVTPGSTPGGLKISKTVESSDGGNIDQDEEFTFTLNLKSAGGSSLTDKYPMVCYDQNGQQIESTSISNGDTFKLMHGQHVMINYLPVGAQYTVTEVYHDGYSVSHKINEGTITGGQTASGSITSGKTDVVDYYNKAGYILPATGGIGTRCYTFGGLLLMMGSLMYGVARRRRKS